MKASCTANASRLAQCAYQIGPHILPVFYLERSVSFFPAIHDDDDERVVGLGTRCTPGPIVVLRRNVAQLGPRLCYGFTTGWL